MAQPKNANPTPNTTVPNGPTGDLPYGDYGYHPGVAQAAQQQTYAPFIPTQPAFTQEQLAMANWFTTRVHLAPIGKA